MKKIITKYGLIAGLIIGVWLIIFAAAGTQIPTEYGMLFGYAAMLISFSMIFVAIKTFRDKYNNGIVSFGQGFRIGLGIALIASFFYVGIWLIEYYFFIPDFFDRYAAATVEKMQTDGASQAEIAATKEQMLHWKELCKNPLVNALVTFSEIIPAGLLVSIVSALILKRKTAAIA